MSLPRAALLGLLTAASAACSDPGAGPQAGAPDAGRPTPLPRAPQVVGLGGPVLASPRVVPVFFANDDPQVVAQVADFVERLGKSAYWAAATSEYGVGPAVGLAPIQLAEAAAGPIDDVAIQAWLAARLDAEDPSLPAPDAGTIYVLHYPAGVTVTTGGGALRGCASFGGYHDSITLDAAHGSTEVAYAVIPRCDSIGGKPGIGAVTGPESHELVEAATDPYPRTRPAYATVDRAHLYWERALGGGETGDLCAQQVDAYTTVPDLPYLVQRVWSNEAARAGRDPCVPALPGEAYFNAAPELDDNVTATYGGQAVTMKGVKIPPGGSRTIDLDLFGDAEGPFTVQAVDVEASMGHPARLSFALDEASGESGQKRRLAITVKEAGPDGTELFYVMSRRAGSGQHVWVGLVGD